ncbi:hypothetical protein [Schaalia cardiffensis]|uniref:hypothetical protein n=1 Tax=Schaalia cardiffensis TaxID=181487 RepID=UPI0023F4768F|nr:hypothetical protein [Schaalia cardiffensis]
MSAVSCLAVFSCPAAPLAHGAVLGVHVAWLGVHGAWLGVVISEGITRPDVSSWASLRLIAC